MFLEDYCIFSVYLFYATELRLSMTPTLSTWIRALFVIFCVLRGTSCILALRLVFLFFLFFLADFK